MARRVDNVTYPASLEITEFGELGSFLGKFCNLLVVLGLLYEKLGRVAFSLFDSSNLLLKSINRTAFALHLVLR